jgi:peptidyl-prolyl cis-trans isomerase B (cyclophilin B)
VCVCECMVCVRVCVRARACACVYIGVISMRRFREPNYAGSQFIICMSDMKAEMDGNYAAFGKVTKGIELLDKIMTVETVKADKLEFLRDDKQKKAVWPADNFPATRQGIDKIVVK